MANSIVNVNDSFNTANISASGSSSSGSGGLVGSLNDSYVLKDCYNSGRIKSKVCSGGIIGEFSGAEGEAFCCYNSGNIKTTGSSKTDSYSGGILGSDTNKNSDLYDCYNTGNVFSYAYDYYSYGSYNNSSAVGVANCNLVSNCYNTGNLYSFTNDGGGTNSVWSLSGNNIKNSYTLREIGKYGGSLLLSEEMKNQSSYNDWDFENTWMMGDYTNTGYPVLKEVSSPLTFNISNEILAAGETLQLTAYKNGIATNDVSWFVSDGDTIVSSKGYVTVAVGYSTITAIDSDGNKANLNIYGYTPAVSMTATDRKIKMTTSGYSNASYFTINGSDTDYIIDYKSSDTSVVEVTSSGYLTPVSAGTATITATTMGGATATQTVTVTAEAESLSLPSTLTIARGSIKKITTTTSPNPTSSIITWTSSDESVATVDSEGNVTGLKTGTTIVTATTDNGFTDTCTVTVNAPITEMAFETPSLTMYVGQEYKLKLNITPTDTTDTITFSTSSSTYASVTSAGTVTAKKAGTATITAKTSSGLKAYCNITIKAWPAVFTVVDSTTSISEDVITTDTTGVRNLERLVTVKDGYNIDVTYSHQINGLNYCGTGTTIDVYDDYGNFVITYTLVVNGDVNGDSVVDVLDASTTEKMSTDAMVYEEAQAYAANGSAIETIDVTSYQYVLNKALLA